MGFLKKIRDNWLGCSTAVVLGAGVVANMESSQNAGSQGLVEPARAIYPDEDLSDHTFCFHVAGDSVEERGTVMRNGNGDEVVYRGNTGLEVPLKGQQQEGEGFAEEGPCR